MPSFRRDMFKASLLAIAIVSMLGTASYMLTPRKPTYVLDIYTQKGGKGQNTSSEAFFYNETIAFFANTSVKNVQVEFKIKGPKFIMLEKTLQTSAEGVGVLELPLSSYAPEAAVGSWNATAEIDIGEETVTDYLPFKVRAISPSIDVFTDRGGEGPNLSSEAFFYNETIVIYAYVTEALLPVGKVQVKFQIMGPPLSGISLTEEKLTNDKGIGTIELTIPYAQYPLNSIIGVWNVVSTAHLLGENITDSLAINIKDLPPPLIDVYTNHGGIGPNTLSAPFYSNETITIYAHVTNLSNASLVNIPVKFQIYGPPSSNITIEEEKLTNDKGIGIMEVNLTRLYQEHAQKILGVWNVIVIVQNRSSDTLAFEVKTPPTPPSPGIDVFTDSGGRGLNKRVSENYTVLEKVYIYAEVTNGTHPLANVQVAFALVNFNTTLIWRGQGETNSSGIATFSITLGNSTEWVGTWIVYANVEINGERYIDTLTFECVAKPSE